MKSCPTAEEIADMVDAGEDISGFFTGNGILVRPCPGETVKIDLKLTLKPPSWPFCVRPIR